MEGQLRGAAVNSEIDRDFKLGSSSLLGLTAGCSLAMAQLGRQDDLALRQDNFILSLSFHQKRFKNRPQFLPNRFGIQFRLKSARYFTVFQLHPASRGTKQLSEKCSCSLLYPDLGYYQKNPSQKTEREVKRCLAESNRCSRFCRPVPNRSAKAPFRIGIANIRFLTVTANFIL